MSTKIYAKLRKYQEPTIGTAENNGNYPSVQQHAGTRQASPGRSGSNFSFLVQTETPGIILKKIEFQIDPKKHIKWKEFLRGAIKTKLFFRKRF